MSCPIKTLKKSEYIKSFKWEGERLSYPEKLVRGDTYPFTWASDGGLYTSAGDPCYGEVPSGLDFEKFEGEPENYKIIQLDTMHGYYGGGGNGPKPTGMICVDDVLYFAFQNFKRLQIPPFGKFSQNGTDAVIVYKHIVKNPAFVPAYENIKEPTFPGHKFGGPVFINYGKNNENARDEYVYAVSSDQWDNGSNMRLGRVKNDRIEDGSAWEFVCSYDIDGEPVWKADLEESIPVLSLHKHIGVPEMVYIKGIDRYLLFTWKLNGDFSPTDGTDLIVMESPEPWGPYSLVHYEEMWEGKDVTPYCPRIPLKWVEEDGLTAWLQFSGSWARLQDMYRSHIRKFKLELY